jgi:hypothetical protein
MNSLYLILIALCFSAGVLTSVIKSDETLSSKVFDKDKKENCPDQKATMNSGVDEVKPLELFTK